VQTCALPILNADQGRAEMEPQAEAVIDVGPVHDQPGARNNDDVGTPGEGTLEAVVEVDAPRREDRARRHGDLPIPLGRGRAPRADVHGLDLGPVGWAQRARLRERHGPAAEAGHLAWKTRDL